MSRLFAVCVLLAPAAVLVAADADDGFKPLFNGHDLTGWVRVNTAPGTFFVKDNEIITTGRPMGFLRTDRQYENFVAEFDWMHVNTKEVGNSGFFVWGDPLPAVGTVYTRGIEVQVLVNLTYTDKKTGAVTAGSHGDLFSIWGASCVPDRPHPLGWERCLPSENRAKGGGEWNHYRVEANDGRITLAVNGKEVSGVSKCRPRKGYLALESEGAECHFRHLKIKELPSTNPKPEECAADGEGWVPLFDGATLDGWNAEGGSWKVAGENLKATGKGDVTSEKAYGPGRLQFDWKARPGREEPLNITAGGKATIVPGKGDGWHRATLSLDAVGPVKFPAGDGLELKNLFFKAK
jgi:3-keto-disaccharide hydrolase